MLYMIHDRENIIYLSIMMLLLLVFLFYATNIFSQRSHLNNNFLSLLFFHLNFIVCIWNFHDLQNTFYPQIILAYIFNLLSLFKFFSFFLLAHQFTFMRNFWIKNYSYKRIIFSCVFVITFSNHFKLWQIFYQFSKKLSQFSFF